MTSLGAFLGDLGASAVAFELHAHSACQEPAIHDDRVAIGVARRGAHEIDRGADELFGLAETSLRRVRFEEFSARRAFDQLAVQVRRENARCDTIHANAVLRPLIGKATDDPEYAGFA